MKRHPPKSPNIRGMDLIMDVNNMMEDAIGPEHGIAIAEIEKIEEKVLQEDGFHQRFQAMRQNGELAFAELPYDAETLSRIKELAEQIRGSFDNFVVLGIGGSALGAIALHGALNHPYHNLLDPGDRGVCPRMFFCDNIDPYVFTRLFNVLDLERTVFNVVTKSGSTVETLSQFLIIRDKLKSALGPEKMKDHFIITTDAEKGDLRKICNDEDFEGLIIPSPVGGRYSCLSPVGLLPAAVAGIDVDGLIAGARSMDLRCRRQKVWENPAYLGATVHYLCNVQRRKPILVLMPYANSLVRLSDWFCQLHAESLGKNGLGQTPVVALGATDQHSQLQLYLDGPNDKAICFLNVEYFPEPGDIPQTPQEYADYSSVAYLGGHSLKEVLQTERLATESALKHHQRPNMTIHLPALCAETIGQLIFQLELQTAFSGLLYQINPFDQPAVELGKRITYHLLGRKGFEARSPELPLATEKNAKYII